MIYRALLLVFSVLSVTISTQAQRKTTNFDRDWRFAFGHSANAEKDFNYGIAALYSKAGTGRNTPVDAAFVDTSWQRLNLPHDWAVTLRFTKTTNFDVQSHGFKPVGGMYPETSIGWYRKSFTVAKPAGPKRFSLTFDGVFRDAKVWVNGFYCGTNESGYLGVSYDITDFLNFDKPNVVTVRVDATQYEGWFYEGAGIYRHVWLTETAPVHIAEDGVFVQADVSGNKAKVKIETTVANEQFINNRFYVSTEIRDRNGKVVASSAKKEIRVGRLEETTVSADLNLSGARLWSLEDPYLYRAYVSVWEDGKRVDKTVVPFGVRKLEIKPNGVFLNGKHVKIKGVNNHQDHAGVGLAMPDHLHYFRVQAEKNMGANAWRMSHNAPAPELLMACDSLGMLVIDEQRLLNSGKEYVDQFRRLLKRDRNHPSIFLWSIGNEEGFIQKTETGNRIAKSLLAIQEELDPTRTSTYAADLGTEYDGVNAAIPVRGFNYRQFAVADYHKAHPNQPIIGTEMGSTVTTRGIYEKDSIRGYVPDQDITAPWWASRAEEWWKLAAVNDYWLGGFIWTGFDYRGEPTPYGWPNVNSHFGIMDVCGFPKNLYYYYKSWWTDRDVLHISPHWNWPEKLHWDKPADSVEVWVNSNAESVELFLNGKSLGSKDMPRNGHLNWTVAYERGKLEAVGKKNGRIIRQSIETTGPAVEVVATPYKTTILADGQDISIINISAVDREGREVPNADNKIRFKISGDGKIIGVGNGDPSSHEPDQCVDGAWERSLFNGHCQVIVQGGLTESTIHFEASAAGLSSGGTDIQTVELKKAQTVTIDTKYERVKSGKSYDIGKIVGADISFLPELEAKGVKFSDKGVQKDAIEILKDHGINYIRLRIFNDPADAKGYSPNQGFCDLEHTLAMAKRVKAAGLKLLLDFHYSDYWADPGHQWKPKAWEGQSQAQLAQSVYDFTLKTMQALKAQGTLPDMVQVGNEINHGMVWPEGNIANPDGLALLFRAGSAAVSKVDAATPIMLHLALGGQYFESIECIDAMLKRHADFDVIGLSYYPKWHGTLEDLENNMDALASRYGKQLVVVEYSALKPEVNKIAFNVAGGLGKGTFIWEPLSTWEKVFDEKGNTNALILEYDAIRETFLKK